MDFITDLFTNLFTSISNFNAEPIFQLTFVALILLSGPVIVFLLAFRGGDL